MDSDENFYKSVISYCNERLIQINIVSFEGADCNLSMLGQCSCETGGRIYRTLLNGSDLDAHFIEIIEENLKNFNDKTGQIDLSIIGDSNCVSINNASHKFCIENLNASTLQELLLEFTYKNEGTDKEYLVFQTQIKTSNSVRILTTKVDIPRAAEDMISNEHLIHVFNLKKLSKLVLENKNMIVAKEYLKLYDKFLTSKAKAKTGLCDVVVRLIKRLPAKQNFRFLNDFDAQILYNNKNLTLSEFLGNEMEFSGLSRGGSTEEEDVVLAESSTAISM